MTTKTTNRIVAALSAFMLVGCPQIRDSRNDDDDSADDDDAVDDDDDSADDDDDDDVDDDDVVDDDDDDVVDDDDDAAAGECQPYVALTCDAPVIGTNAGGPSNFDSLPCGEFDVTGPEAYFELLAPDDGSIVVTLEPAGDADLDLFVLPSGAADCDPDGCLAAGQEVGGETVFFDAVAGESYTIVVDGFDGATDEFTIALSCGPVYPWVAVRSRTTTAADIDISTPGPDIDAVEIGLISGWEGAVDVWAQPGAYTFENGNTNPSTMLGLSDAFDGGACVLDDDGGDARFYSMGGGDPALGDEGWVVLGFGGSSIKSGDLVSVKEIGAAQCDNITTYRQDDYEVYVCGDDFDPDTATIGDLDSEVCLSIAATFPSGGGTSSFTVP